MLAMKLVIQIPCHNEAETLPRTVADLPGNLEGFDTIERLVIDDGSTDQTGEVAARLGIEHIVVLPAKRGLARAFGAGIARALQEGADVIVNTDGDNQYRGEDVARLVAPILRDEADMVIGARPIDEIAHFSAIKKRLQRLGSGVVRLVSQTRTPDATSGFRAFSREAALRLNVFSNYTYTLETIIQAGQSNMRIVSIPVGVNPPLRQSRLISSSFSYIHRSLMTMLRAFVLYRPFRFFVLAGSLPLTAGLLIGCRFLYFLAIGQGDGKIQSLILAAVLILMGFQLGILGLVADLIATNRRILEDLQQNLRRGKEN